MAVWTFEQSEVVHPLDGRTRIAAKLYSNGHATNWYAYSRQRVRHWVGAEMVGASLDTAVVRERLQLIETLHYLPEHNHDFPTVMLCDCQKHAWLLNADGLHHSICPAYSLSVLHQRACLMSPHQLPERYRETIRGRIGDLKLPWESPLDLLAASILVSTTNWCELE